MDRACFLEENDAHAQEALRLPVQGRRAWPWGGAAEPGAQPPAPGRGDRREARCHVTLSGRAAGRARAESGRAAGRLQPTGLSHLTPRPRPPRPLEPRTLR